MKAEKQLIPSVHLQLTEEDWKNIVIMAEIVEKARYSDETEIVGRNVPSVKQGQLRVTADKIINTNQTLSSHETNDRK